MITRRMGALKRRFIRKRALANPAAQRGEPSSDGLEGGDAEPADDRAAERRILLAPQRQGGKRRRPSDETRRNADMSQGGAAEGDTRHETAARRERLTVVNPEQES
jgi:hypothetical protein